MRSLVTRLKRLEQVRAAQEPDGQLVVEFGYVVKRLPPDYSGPQHLVTVGRLPDGKHQWEERPGPSPSGDGNRLFVEFVRAAARPIVECDVEGSR